MKYVRNDQISRSIDAARIPILPFELGLAHSSLLAHIERRDQLGGLLREAMDQSSETWHDNAPAEAITGEAHRLTNLAQGVLRTIDNGDVYDYVESTGEIVTLGSVIQAAYLDTSRTITALLTGITRTLPEELVSDLGEDTACITLSSPLGKAVFGKKVGDTAQFTAGKKTHRILIVSIQQYRPQSDSLA